MPHIAITLSIFQTVHCEVVRIILTLVIKCANIHLRTRQDLLHVKSYSVDSTISFRELFLFFFKFPDVLLPFVMFGVLTGLVFEPSLIVTGWQTGDKGRKKTMVRRVEVHQQTQLVHVLNFTELPFAVFH